MSGLDSAGSARKVSAMYSPDMLPNHKGPYFSHEKSRLVQHQIKDEKGNLIVPCELCGKLTEGTLFSAQVSLLTYINKVDTFQASPQPPVDSAFDGVSPSKKARTT
ncbi:hypothetical protein B0H14DRAFT_3520579 [Mycena olivaceomarginata]|nr:hypothetical protein B0H14DRAFT_3520579 [Mycena olivaceomarginata]